MACDQFKRVTQPAGAAAGVPGGQWAAVFQRRTPAELQAWYNTALARYAGVDPDEINDYTRVVHSLGYALGMCGLEPESERGLGYDLSSLFHDPLSGIRSSTPVDKMAGMLDWTLRRDATSEYGYSSIGRILKREVPYYLYTSSDLATPADYEGRIRKLEYELAGRNGQFATYRDDLERARWIAAGLRRKALIVQALLGEEAPGARPALAKAEEIEAAANHVEESLTRNLDDMRQELKDLPRRLAEELRPLEEVRVNASAYGGCVVPPGLPVISDGYMAFDPSKLKKSQVARIARPPKASKQTGKPVDAERASGILATLAGTVAPGTPAARVLGYRRARVRGELRSIAYVVPPEGDAPVAYADAAQLRFVGSVADYDSIKIGGKNPSGAPYLLFYRQGEVVAGLTTLAVTAEDPRGTARIDIATARAVAARRAAEGSAPEPEPAAPAA